MSETTNRRDTMTLLYAAVGRMIAKVDADIAARADRKAPAEDQVMVIIIDGLENHSREQTRSTIFEMIEQRRRDGWVFVFLGANQDVYPEGERMAVPVGNRARLGGHQARIPGDVEGRVALDHSSPHEAAGPANGRRRRVLPEGPGQGTTPEVRRAKVCRSS